MSFAPLSFSCATTISAYRIVKMSAGNTIALCDTVTATPVGVTQDDTKNAGEAVPVIVSGLAKVQFNDTVAAGGLVKCDASGYGVAHVGISTGSYVLGVLVGNAVAATGTIAEVLVNPFYIIID